MPVGSTGQAAGGTALSEAYVGTDALSRLFEGSAKNLIAAMAESDALSDRDIDELEDYLARLKAERGGAHQDD